MNVLFLSDQYDIGKDMTLGHVYAWFSHIMDLDKKELVHPPVDYSPDSPAVQMMNSDFTSKLLTNKGLKAGPNLVFAQKYKESGQNWLQAVLKKY